jgi:hypothetical protein
MMLFGRLGQSERQLPGQVILGPRVRRLSLNFLAFMGMLLLDVMVETSIR